MGPFAFEPAHDDSAYGLNDEDHPGSAQIAYKAVLRTVLINETASITSPQELFDLSKGVHDLPVCKGWTLIPLRWTSA